MDESNAVLTVRVRMEDGAVVDAVCRQAVYDRAKDVFTWRSSPDCAANHEKRRLIRELREDLMREARA